MCLTWDRSSGRGSSTDAIDGVGKVHGAPTRASQQQRGVGWVPLSESCGSTSILPSLHNPALH